MVPIRESNQHTDATMIALYIPFHMVRLDQCLSADFASDTVSP